jgi:alkanesulfonate monooxygenase SsuD/methylene tetrahydromethanopterin reductase-like flavin-dependent oxidoreductase (luciferase family)
MAVEFGFNLPLEPIPEPVDQLLERLDALLPMLPPSFKSLWATDHLFWGDTPVHESWTLISYAAARYPTMQVGTMVTGQNYRNPGLLAKMAATIQILSGGRLIFGIGAGWKEDEYRGYGYAFPTPGERVAQLEEALEIATRLWKNDGKVSYQGAHYQISDAYLVPKPRPIPPIVVGGGGKKTMRVAAKLADWWNISDTPIERYTECVNTLHAHCRDLGRDPDSIRLTWFGRVSVGESMDGAIARGGGKWTPNNAFVGTPAQIVEQMKPFVDLGVDYFMIDILDVGDPAVLDTLNHHVFANL